MSEPVTLAEAKEYCRIDDTTDAAANTAQNALISALIVAAREGAETRCRRGMTMEDWPGGFPEQARVWVLVQVATMFANREAVTDKPVYSLGHVDRLLDRYVIPALS